MTYQRVVAWCRLARVLGHGPGIPAHRRRQRGGHAGTGEAFFDVPTGGAVVYVPARSLPFIELSPPVRRPTLRCCDHLGVGGGPREERRD